MTALSGKDAAAGSQNQSLNAVIFPPKGPINNGGIRTFFMDSERVLKIARSGEPGLQGFVILAISRRPRALTRRPPTILKHALAVALCACVSGFVRLVVMNVNAMTFVAPNLACGQARGGNIPRSWGCDRRATKPQAKFGATRRAAGLFRPAFVARSLQIHGGICSSFAPRLGEKSLAANVIAFTFMTTEAPIPASLAGRRR